VTEHWHTFAWGRGIGPDDLQRPLPTSPFCDSVVPINSNQTMASQPLAIHPTSTLLLFRVTGLYLIQV